MNSVRDLADKIETAFRNHHAPSLYTVAISGIDASGKGFITKRVQDELGTRGLRIANINIDPWQTPLAVRLKKENPAENIYEHIFRWEDFFEQVIIPFRKNRSLYLRTTGIRSDADIYYPLVYDYVKTDILLLEGILLFKQKYFSYYDLRVWIDCSFETGLQRALSRNVENLDKERLLHDYHTYYYAAQRLHFEKDHPKEKADLIFDNDNQAEMV